MGTVPEVFNHTKFGKVRVVIIDGEPYFVGKDVAMALGYKEPEKAVREHVDTEDKGVSVLDTPGGKQSVKVINESGLYSLVLSSTLPGAKQFKHWVTSEVLPSIRKYGYYENGATPNDSDNAEIDYKKFDGFVKLAKISTSEPLKNLFLIHAAKILDPDFGTDVPIDTFFTGTTGNAGTNYGNAGTRTGTGKYYPKNLTLEEIKEIKYFYENTGKTLRQLAEEYGVSKQTILRTVRGKW